MKRIFIVFMFAMLALSFVFLTACGGCVFNAPPENPIPPSPTPPPSDPVFEKVLVVDGSLNMWAVGEDNKSRMDRAIELMKNAGEWAIDDGFSVSIIAAYREPVIILENSDSLQQLDAALEDIEKFYGSGDIIGAVNLAKDLTYGNEYAQIILYTSSLEVTGVCDSVSIVDVSCDSEWNAAILDVVYVLELDIFGEGYYEFWVYVASFNKNTYLTISLEVFDYDGDEIAKEQRQVALENGVTQVVVFDNMGVTEYYSVRASIVEAGDSFEYDNYFLLFANKIDLRILYVTDDPCMLLWVGVRYLRFSLRQKNWRVSYKTVSLDEVENLSGFDFYIFENQMPDILPSDGVVWLINPNIAPENSGFIIEGATQTTGDDLFIFRASPSGETSPILHNVIINRTTDRFINLYTAEGFDTLLYIGDNAVKLLNNDKNLIVTAFDIWWIEFDCMLYVENIVLYFFEDMVVDNVFNIGDGVNINGVFERLYSLGSVDLRKELVTGREVVRRVFVRVPIDESFAF